MAPRKVCPHGYEKRPSHVDYSSKFLKVVRVREVESSNLSTPTDKHIVRSPPSGKAVFFYINLALWQSGFQQKY